MSEAVRGHTPGEWRVDVQKQDATTNWQEWAVTIRGPKQFPDADYGHRGTEIARINTGAGGFDRNDVASVPIVPLEWRYNAPLMAMAPRMLAALKAVVMAGESDELVAALGEAGLCILAAQKAVE